MAMDTLTQGRGCSWAATLSSVAGIDTHGGRRHIGHHRKREWAAVQQRRRPAMRVAVAGETEVSREGQRRGHEPARPSVSMSSRSFCRKKRTGAGRGRRAAAGGGGGGGRRARRASDLPWRK